MIQRIKVTGNYNALTGGEATGSVIIEPNVPSLVSSADNTVIIGGADEVLAKGVLTAYLPPNDSVLLPNGFAYRVREKLQGVTNRPTWYFNLTSDMGPEVDLFTVTPVIPRPMALSSVYGILDKPNEWTDHNVFSDLDVPGHFTLYGHLIESMSDPTKFLRGDGAWADPVVDTGPSSGYIRTFRKLHLETGLIHTDSTPSFAPVPGVTLTIPSAVGDWIEFQLFGMWTSSSGFLDMAVSVGGVLKKFCSSDTDTPKIEGDAALYPNSGFIHFASKFSFQVEAEHLDSGNVTVVLVYKGGAGSEIYATTDYTLRGLLTNDHPIS